MYVAEPAGYVTHKEMKSQKQIADISHFSAMYSKVTIHFRIIIDSAHRIIFQVLCYIKVEYDNISLGLVVKNYASNELEYQNIFSIRTSEYKPLKWLI